VKLVLGVIDFPYVAAKPPKVVTERKAKAALAKAGPDTTTTGKVAAILEAKYAVMGNFVALHQIEIAELLSISMAETLEALMQGAPLTIDPFGAAMSETAQLFRTYIDDEEIAQTGQDGVPTKAARNGVSSRFKDQEGGRRPSFQDTGLYESSFVAWVK
jgi:hypothetical protein